MTTQDISIQTLSPDQVDRLVELVELYAEVFAMAGFSMPARKHLQSLLHKDGITFLVAVADGQVVGGLTAHDLPSTYSESAEIYVYDLAVANAYQRRGVGTRLLKALETLCEQRGKAEFFLQADADDTDALNFYRATRGVEEDVRHFSYDTSRRAGGKD